jgi:hypothetical protein
MNNKIDVSDIMKELEEKMRKGLSEGTLDVTGISKLIGEHLEKAKEKVLEDASNVIKSEVKPDTKKECKKCGNSLKKTKKRTSESQS